MWLEDVILLKRYTEDFAVLQCFCCKSYKTIFYDLVQSGKFEGHSHLGDVLAMCFKVQFSADVLDLFFKHFGHIAFCRNF